MTSLPPSLTLITVAHLVRPFSCRSHLAQVIVPVRVFSSAARARPATTKRAMATVNSRVIRTIRASVGESAVLAPAGRSQPAGAALANFCPVYSHRPRRVQQISGVYGRVVGGRQNLAQFFWSALSG